LLSIALTTIRNSVKRNIRKRELKHTYMILASNFIEKWFYFVLVSLRIQLQTMSMISLPQEWIWWGGLLLLCCESP